ncbi:PDZ domain-containing protein [Flavobacterium sp. LS2P90]|uniref:PDZ domain-containing protein n=1 Tax=Flavobacterium xylosi TaxID=3230415 RepID=A0ABW6I031_9FLAO
MKKVISVFFIFVCVWPILAQDGFQFNKEVDKVTVAFKLINNLIFIPIKVNGIELNFLLDSGVEETILFSLEEKKEISFSNVEKITLRGLGREEPIEGLKATNNILEVQGLKSANHLLYIVLDQEFNLSSHIGIPVNGIIGYHFFKNNLVEINYERKRITIHRNNDKNRKKIEKKFKETPITIEKNKPYVVNGVTIDSIEFPAKLLIDIGNSDALWLFDKESVLIKIPTKNFEDYLGKGFSGDVEGKRARVLKFKMSEFEFKNPIAAFPDSISLKSVKMVPGRVGSVGGEIFRRFTIVLDYTNRVLYLKKNREFNAPFNYNKSGIEIQQQGMQWVQETFYLQTLPVVVSEDPFKIRTEKNGTNFKYKFNLKPVYSIANVRKNSPAFVSGLLKDDIIISINGNPSYKYSLQQMNSFLKSEEELWITMEVERNNKTLKFKFQLQDVL